MPYKVSFVGMYFHGTQVYKGYPPPAPPTPSDPRNAHALETADFPASSFSIFSTGQALDHSKPVLVFHLKRSPVEQRVLTMFPNDNSQSAV